MIKVIIKHLYITVMAIFIVMMGNVLADKYGPRLSAKISSISSSADQDVNDVKNTVNNWNKQILE
ncbi:hypothetical protein A9Q78_11260 [Methylophaga sp. 41_12_T18]|nr:hypothetical protein A9Q78_11260 [Methylophaga sp. 41_12_T18]